MAVAEGRWDEAVRALSDKGLREFLPAKRLSQELAHKLLARAGERIAEGASSAGWRDLDRAANLGAKEEDLKQFRISQQNERLEKVLHWLAIGDTQSAQDELARMKRRRLASGTAKVWASITAKVAAAQQCSAKGEFRKAVAHWKAAKDLLPSDSSAPTTLEPATTELASNIEESIRVAEEKGKETHELEPKLHEQISAGQWSGVLATADALLELAPSHAAARRARRKAWKAVGMEVTRAYQGPPAGQLGGHVASLQLRRPAKREQRASWKPNPQKHSTQKPVSAKSDTVTPSQSNQHSGPRMVAWIDAVGGYLVCLGDTIVLGRPDPVGGVDVPILADLSRRHAVIRREGGDYVLEPRNKVTINGVKLTEPTVVHDGDSIGLSDAVELKFTRPHVLSATAVLQLQTHNKLEPAVDGIVLMADTCVFGPQAHSHVRCRKWSEELVLFRHGDELRCRGNSPLTIDDEPGVEVGEIAENSRIEGEDFALSFESL